jgi:hypothetical protein
VSGYRGGTVAAPDTLSIVEDALRDHFGHAPQRASVSFVGVEPIEILRFEPIPGEHAYLSLGASRHAMTAPDRAVRTEDGPRAELMVHIRGLDPPDLWRQLAVLAAAPAVEGVVYTQGMTVDLGTAFGAGARCTGGVVAASAIGPIDTPAGVVEVLQVLPATPTELAWSRVHGADELVRRWTLNGIDLLDLTRISVGFAS